MDRATRPTVAVVGAGFSGVMTAIHLLRDPDGPIVRLLERRERFGLGTAYSTRSTHHLLNVRSSNMSAFPEQPAHFTDWLAQHPDVSAREGFVTRQSYGRYLRSLLKDALETCVPGRLVLEPDAATEIRRSGSQWHVKLAAGRAIHADAVVLAIGNLPPAMPFCDNQALATDYVADPWNWNFELPPTGGAAFLLGTGLTAVDVALELHARYPKLPMIMMSRRGLVPRRHGPAAVPNKDWTIPVGGSVTALTRYIRTQADMTNWRAIIDGVRPHVQTIWRDWSSTERRRFLRHVQPWWDVHRHRLSPPVADEFDALITNSLLTVSAGRLVAFGRTTGALTIEMTPRGAVENVMTPVRLVINCTGPNANIALSDDPLVASLVSDGLIRSDPESLGVDVDRSGRLADSRGGISPSLFALGPIARGQWWEITSVPDIRLQASEIASTVLTFLKSEFPSNA